MERKGDTNGNPIGVHNSNSILDTHEYKIEFPDGATDVFTANMITESMYSQVNSNRHPFVILSKIIDHKSNGTAASKDDGFEVTNQGQQ